MPKLSTFLWFNNQAEEAATFYTSLFQNSRLGKTVHIPGSGPDGKEVVQLVEFELNGHPFVAFNGGPYCTFNDAVSFVIQCENQDELDLYWKRLTADGGQEVQCGWLRDKFGVSWQIIPNILSQLTSKGDSVRTRSMMDALRTMKKLDFAGLQRAYDEGA